MVETGCEVIDGAPTTPTNKGGVKVEVNHRVVEKKKKERKKKKTERKKREREGGGKLKKKKEK